jgi:hypothetical protein
VADCAAAGERVAAEGFALDVLFHCDGVMQQSPVETLAVNVLCSRPSS